MSLERVIDKYSYYLDSDIIDLIESLRNSHFLRLFLEEAEIRINVEKCWVHIDNIVDLCKEYNYPIFNIEGEKDIVKEHIEHFLSIVKFYNQTYPDKPITVSNGLWKDSIAPKTGSARASMQS